MAENRVVTHAITIRAPGIVNQIQTECRIGPPATQGVTPTLHPVRGIWDTGAQGSAVTMEVASAVGLKQTGMGPVDTAGGRVLQPRYLLDLYLPNGVVFRGLTVTGMGQITGADFLIGMDVMSQGDKSLTNLNGQTVFSFRVPSAHQIDFVAEERVGRAKAMLHGIPKTRRVTVVSPDGSEEKIRKSDVMPYILDGWELKI